MSARIVFDLDGTLIDSAPDIQHIANIALAGIGAEPITLHETHSFIGEGIHVFVEKMRNARDIPSSYQEALLEELVTLYDDAVTLTRLYPGVLAALNTLSQTHRLGICTNKLYRPCVAVLKHLQIDQYFATVWGGDNHLARKPDPRPLLAAFEELGTGPCIYVGDSEVDAKTALRVGVPFILFTKGYRKSEVEEIPHTLAMDDFNQLPKHVALLLSDPKHSL